MPEGRSVSGWTDPFCRSCVSPRMFRSVALAAPVLALLLTAFVTAGPPSRAAKKAPAPASPQLRCQVFQHGGKTRLEAKTDPRTGACTGFEVLDRRGRAIIIHHDAFYGSGRLVSSSDGRRVIYVNDFPHAKLQRDGRILPLGRPKGIDAKQVDALVVFYDGKKVGSYTLNDLLVRTFLVDTRPGHVQWLTGDVGFLKSPVGKTLTLTTTSFRQYTFDTETGKALQSGDTNDWQQCDAMVYGNFSTFKDGSCGARPYWVLKGEVPNPFHVDLDDRLSFSNGFQTACLVTPERPGEDDPRLLATKLYGPLNGLKLQPPATP